MRWLYPIVKLAPSSFQFKPRHRMADSRHPHHAKTKLLASDQASNSPLLTYLMRVPAFDISPGIYIMFAMYRTRLFKLYMSMETPPPYRRSLP